MEAHFFSQYAISVFTPLLSEMSSLCTNKDQLRELHRLLSSFIDFLGMVERDNASDDVNVVSGVPSSQYLGSTKDDDEEEDDEDSFDYDVCIDYDIPDLGYYSSCCDDDHDGCEIDVNDSFSSDSSTIGPIRHYWSDGDQFPSSEAFPVSARNVSDGDFGLSTLFDLGGSSNDGADHATGDPKGKQKARNSSSRSV